MEHEHPMNDANPRIHPRKLIGYGVILGLGMVLAGWAWVGGVQGRGLSEWFPLARWRSDLALGALAGAGAALAAWVLHDRVPAFRRIARMLCAVLDMDALRYPHAVLFGLIAGIPEEILFRGALQPTLGIVPASILFGALHALTPAYFIYATLAGMLLGGLADWRDGLWAPIAAHVVIDTVTFVLLIRRWRAEFEISQQ